MRKSIDGYRRVSAVDRFRFPPAHGGHARGTTHITRGPIFGDRYSSGTVSPLSCVVSVYSHRVIGGKINVDGVGKFDRVLIKGRWRSSGTHAF